MKLAGLLRLTLSCAALTCGTSYAAPAPQPQASEVARNAVGEDLRGRSGVLEERKKTSPANNNKRTSNPFVYDKSYSPNGTNRARRPTRNGRDWASGGAADFHPALSEKSAGTPKKGWMQNQQTIDHPLAVRPPSIGGPAARSLSDVSHRGPNPAVIAGLTNLKSGNAAAIDGTRVNRKP